jgi:branched-chain amino acid transport system permease protein
MRLPRIDPRRAGGFAAGLLAVVTMPAWLPATGFLTVSSGVFMALLTIATAGLVLLLGFAGQLSLGQNAFYGIGMYGSTVLTVKSGLNPWIALVVAMLAAIVVAVAVGVPTFRLRGHALAIATLGLGIIAFVVFNFSDELTGGANGMGGVPPLSLFGWEVTGDTQWLYVSWAAAGLVLLLAHNLIRSPFGRSLQAIRGSEAAAESAGINVLRAKVATFAVAAAFASFAGSLYAHYLGFVSPSVVNVLFSVEVLVAAALGGLGSIGGAAMGAIAVTVLGAALEKYIPEVIPSASGDVQLIGYGLVLVVFLNLAPRGFAGLLVGRRA